MSESLPLVSVLIPCYNVEKYVVESVSSILDQTYTNIELVIINDCSTDGTAQKLEKLSLVDHRIKLYHNETNLKLIKTLNKGISLCKGKYIARMDADDISLPTRIEKQVDFLEENTDYSVVSTMFYTFRDGSSKMSLYKNPLKNEELQAALLFRSAICHPAVMIRKTLFTELSLEFEEGYLHVEDYALWSKAIYCTKMANIDETLLNYRVHKSQISSINELRQVENKKEVFKIHCNKLQIPVDDESIDIYASVAECVPKHSTFEYLEQCEKFMILLINKNERLHFCSQDFLLRMLSLHWIRLCANSRLGVNVLNRCFASNLYIKANYTTQDILFLYIKCILKIEYKKSFLYKVLFR